MSTSSTPLKGVLLLAGAALCWSLGGILIRLVEASDWTIVFWRSLFMSLTLLTVLAIWTGGRLAAPFRAAGWKGMLSGAFMACAFICFVLSITRTTVANTLVTMSIMPFVAAILAWAMLKEPIRPRTWAAMALAALGLVVMFADSLRGEVKHLGVDAGIVCTASHNPIQWNGLKFLNSQGIAPPMADAEPCPSYRTSSRT